MIVNKQQTTNDTARSGNDSTDQEYAYSKPNVPTLFIRSKKRRIELRAEYREISKRERKKRKLKRKKLEEELGDKASPKQIPRTLENTREPDATFIREDDDEVFEDIETDEFSSYFNLQTAPKVLITTNINGSKSAINFCRKDLRNLIPNSQFYNRKNYNVKEIIQYCKNREFTDVIVINEDRRIVNGLLLSHLPNGPTALFKVSSIRRMVDVPDRAGYVKCKPELILNNFDTRLGTTIGRMLAALFPPNPDFKKRKVITFHNQRDFIFVRQHRYVFDDDNKVRIQEMGPRFTLKLKSLQRGTFDSKYGEYEWLPKKENITSRRRFFL